MTDQLSLLQNPKEEGALSAVVRWRFHNALRPHNLPLRTAWNMTNTAWPERTITTYTRHNTFLQTSLHFPLSWLVLFLVFNIHLFIAAMPDVADATNFWQNVQNRSKPVYGNTSNLHFLFFLIFPNISNFHLKFLTAVEETQLLFSRRHSWNSNPTHLSHLLTPAYSCMNWAHFSDRQFWKVCRVQHTNSNIRKTQGGWRFKKIWEALCLVSSQNLNKEKLSAWPHTARGDWLNRV